MPLNKENRRDFSGAFGGKIKIGCDHEVFTALESDVFNDHISISCPFQDFGDKGTLFGRELPYLFDFGLGISDDPEGIFTGFCLINELFIMFQVFFKDLLIVILQRAAVDPVGFPGVILHFSCGKENACKKQYV